MLVCASLCVLFSQTTTNEPFRLPMLPHRHRQCRQCQVWCRRRSLRRQRRHRRCRSLNWCVTTTSFFIQTLITRCLSLCQCINRRALCVYVFHCLPPPPQLDAASQEGSRVLALRRSSNYSSRAFAVSFRVVFYSRRDVLSVCIVSSSVANDNAPTGDEEAMIGTNHLVRRRRIAAASATSSTSAIFVVSSIRSRFGRAMRVILNVF